VFGHVVVVAVRVIPGLLALALAVWWWLKYDVLGR
jgi:hypothetical protein